MVTLSIVYYLWLFHTKAVTDQTVLSTKSQIFASWPLNVCGSWSLKELKATTVPSLISPLEGTCEPYQ